MWLTGQPFPGNLRIHIVDGASGIAEVCFGFPSGEWQELLGGLGVALFDGGEDLAEVVHRRTRKRGQTRKRGHCRILRQDTYSG
jgi:hypothetical protein